MQNEVWFFCYPDRDLARTFHLSPHDFGAWARANLWYYSHGPLPNDNETLRQIMRVEAADWDRCKANVMTLFSLNGDGRWHDPITDREIEIRDSLSQKNKAKTAAARAARWPNHQQSTQSVTETVTQRLTEADKITYRGELERVMERMKAISDTYSGHQAWRDDDKREWAKLKKRRQELRDMLGVTV